MKRILLVSLLVFLIVTALALVFRQQLTAWFFRPTESQIPTGTTSQNGTEPDSLRVFSEQLDTPWSIAWLPDSALLVTERNGTLKRLGTNGQSYTIDGVREVGEGGLLGLALHPDFSDNHRLYIYFTTNRSGGMTNTVDEYTLVDTTLTYTRTLLANIPAASNHNGGGIAFGPDKKLYITTGDAAQPDKAQDTNSLAGKILRINDDGSIPTDNPFGNAVWSYGHRNPQGLDWDSNNQLWSVEHGPSGDRKGYGKDELNRINKGANYGWPVIAGAETAPGMQAPVAQSGDTTTWAPSGIAFLDGSLYFAGLRGQTLYQAKIQTDGSVSLVGHFAQEFGRLRAVSAKDNSLYVSTSNRDGRGSPEANDDRILQIPVTLVK